MENAGEKVFFCPNCFQTERLTLRTALRYTVEDGSAEVDPGYLERYLEFVAKYAEKIIHRNTYRRFLQKHVTINEIQFSKMLIRLAFEKPGNEEDAERFGDLLHFDAIFLCPNCGWNMEHKFSLIKECERTLFLGGPQQPGCYLCQSIRPGLGRDNALEWCAGCYAASGGDTDCEHCIYEFAKKKFRLTGEEIEARGEELILFYEEHEEDSIDEEEG